jgi:hypothetical protein
VTVTEALQLARSQGVEVTLDGDDLVLKAEAAPPPGLLAILGRGKWDIVAALRQREAEERRLIAQWINNHFTSSPAGVCAHCGEGARADDAFVLLFVGADRGEVHSSCHSTWLAEREAAACEALRSSHSTAFGHRGLILPSKQVSDRVPVSNSPGERQWPRNNIAEITMQIHILSRHAVKWPPTNTCDQSFGARC